MKSYSFIDSIRLGQHAVYINLGEKVTIYRRWRFMYVVGTCLGPRVIQAGLWPVTVYPPSHWSLRQARWCRRRRWDGAERASERARTVVRSRQVPSNSRLGPTSPMSFLHIPPILLGPPSIFPYQLVSPVSIRSLQPRTPARRRLVLGVATDRLRFVTGTGPLRQVELTLYRRLGIYQRVRWGV